MNIRTPRCNSLARRLIVPCVAALLLLLIPSLSQAASRELCIKIDVLTDDSGNGEDFWTNANSGVDNTGYPARGVRIELKKNNGTGASIGTWDTDPTTGCATPSNSTPPNADGPYQVIVYGYATDSGGNHVRIHDGGTATDHHYPGATISYGFINVFLVGGTLDLKVLAHPDERWTTFASAAETLFRYHDGLAGKTTSIGFDTASGCSSSSSWGNSNGFIQTGAGYALVKISRCGSENQTKSKFLVSHEVGHTIGRHRYGYNGNDMKRDNYVNSNPCTSTGDYSMGSAEYNSIGFTEGYAWFVSGAVWNTKAASGIITRNGTVWDLANGPNGDAAGGRISNVCTSDRNTEGVSTNHDWMRFFWDFFNDSNCTFGTPSQFYMQEVYKWTRENHRNGSYLLKEGPPGSANFHHAVANVLANTMSVQLPGCLIATPMNHNCVGGRKMDGSPCI